MIPFSIGTVALLAYTLYFHSMREHGGAPDVTPLIMPGGK